LGIVGAVAARIGLEGRGLDLGYNTRPVVHAADIRLQAGRVAALVGPNGSGKSTLLRGLARLHHLDAGLLRLGDGRDAYALLPRAFAREVTMLAQNRPTPSGLAVRDVVGFGRHPTARASVAAAPGARPRWTGRCGSPASPTSPTARSTSSPVASSSASGSPAASPRPPACCCSTSRRRVHGGALDGHGCRVRRGRVATVLVVGLAARRGGWD